MVRLEIEADADAAIVEPLSQQFGLRALASVQDTRTRESFALVLSGGPNPTTRLEVSAFHVKEP